MENDREDAIAADIRGIKESLDGVSEYDRTRMPERNFVQVFLPFFAGTANPYGVSLDNWVGHAKGFCRSVDVVDPAGKVLFTVPPIMDRRAISPLSGDRTSIMHVVASAQQYAGISPMDGARYLDAQLSERALVMKAGDANAVENYDEWLAIFERYDIKPVITGSGEELVAPSEEAKKDEVPLEDDIAGWASL